jgi:phospholipid/cholesterol/gamma-HCH transport system substrate-binding protein
MSRVARLGAFILITLAILAAGVFIIGSKEYLFRSTYQLKAQFDNVAGLAEGADVQVGGVHSGTVTAIDYLTGQVKRLRSSCTLTNRRTRLSSATL